MSSSDSSNPSSSSDSESSGSGTSTSTSDSDSQTPPSGSDSQNSPSGSDSPTSSEGSESDRSTDLESLGSTSETESESSTAPKQGILSEPGYNEGQPGTWYYTELINYGFPEFTHFCDFSEPRSTLVRIFVANSQNYEPVLVNHFVMKARVLGEYRNYEQNRERLIAVRVHRPFRFWPPRQAGQKIRADYREALQNLTIEWIDPEADINNQITPADYPLSDRRRRPPSELETYFRQDPIKGRVSRVYDPSVLQEKKEPLEGHDLYTVVNPIGQGHPKYAKYNDVVFPSYATEIEPQTAMVHGVPREIPAQNVKMRSEAQQILVPMSPGEYQPVKVQAESEYCYAKFDPEHRPVRIENDSENNRYWRFWPLVTPGQRVPEHFRQRAGVQNRQRIESIDEELPQPSSEPQYPYPEERDGVPGHVYQIKILPEMVPISPCTQVFDGVLRQVPKQDMLVTTPPFTWWFKDLPTYTTYVFRQMSVPRRSGILKLTTMPGQPDEIEVPHTMDPDIRFRYHPEPLPHHDISMFDENTRLHAVASNANRCVQIDSDNNMVDMEYHDVTNSEYNSPENVKRRKLRNKKKRKKPVDYNRLATMNAMKETTKKEQISTEESISRLWRTGSPLPEASAYSSEEDTEDIEDEEPDSEMEHEEPDSEMEDNN